MSDKKATEAFGATIENQLLMVNHELDIVSAKYLQKHGDKLSGEPLSMIFAQPAHYYPYLKILQDHAAQVKDPVIGNALKSISKELNEVAQETKNSGSSADLKTRQSLGRRSRRADPLVSTGLENVMRTFSPTLAV